MTVLMAKVAVVDNRKIMEETLKQKISFGLFTLVTREALIKVIAIVGQIYLFRIYAPDVFGKLAILSFIIGITEIFTDSGLSAAIIREKKTLTSKVLSSIFYCKLFFTLTAISVLVLLSQFFSSWFNGIGQFEIQLLLVLSLTLLTKPLRGILLALIEKDLRYGVIPIIDLSGLGIYYLVAIVGAVSGWGIWIFILAALIKDLVELTISLYFVRWWPSWHFSWKDVRDKLKFGVYLQLSVILGVLHQSVVPLIGGIATNPSSVGLLDWSKNVTSIPKSIMENVGRISFSSFSHMQDNKIILSKAIMTSMQLLTVLAVFCFVFAWGYGEHIVRFVLTDAWLPALPALYWMLASLFFIAACTSLNQAIVVLGKTKELFFGSLGAVIIELIFAWFLTQSYGFIGIAMASCVGWFLIVATGLYLAKRNGLVLSITTIMYKNILALFVLTLSVFVLKNFPSTLPFLLLQMFLVAVMYLGVLLVLVKNEVLLLLRPLIGAQTLKSLFLSHQ